MHHFSPPRKIPQFMYKQFFGNIDFEQAFAPNIHSKPFPMESFAPNFNTTLSASFTFSSLPDKRSEVQGCYRKWDHIPPTISSHSDPSLSRPRHSPGRDRAIYIPIISGPNSPCHKAYKPTPELGPNLQRHTKINYDCSTMDKFGS